MPGRLLTLAAVALVAIAGASGCADQVSPAAQVGDTTISHNDLMTEVEAWSTSPALVETLQIPFLPGSEAAGYSNDFVGIVLSNRVIFELHNEEFERLGLELTDEELQAAREAVPPAMLDELGGYGDTLLADIARQFRIQEELADGYQTWALDAFAQTDIEVSSRYGTWDTTTGTVTAPSATVPGDEDGDPEAVTR